MYVTLYAADNQQIVLDAIKDTENAKPLFTNHYITKGKRHRRSWVCSSLKPNWGSVVPSCGRYGIQ